MAQAQKTSVENLGRNLRALIQQLVVETRKNNFKTNSPETQNLLKKFASQAHNYQVAAKNAKIKLSGNQARANIKGEAAAKANAALAAVAATVASAAGKAEQAANEAAKGNISKVGLLTRLKTAKNKAVASVKTFIASKPSALARAPVNYNRIITAYNSKANTIDKKTIKAKELSNMYRSAKFKNVSRAGRLLTQFPRVAPLSGRYEARQKFLNEMVAFYKKQINEAEAKRLANVATEAAALPRVAARALYNSSAINNNTGRRKSNDEIWASVPVNIRNKIQNFKEVERVLNTYGNNKQVKYAKKILRERAPSGWSGMAAAVAPIFGPNTKAVATAAAWRQKPPSGFLISRGIFTLESEGNGPSPRPGVAVNVVRHAKGPTNVFYGRPLTEPRYYRKLKRNAKNPGKFNFNNSNTRSYIANNTGFEVDEGAASTALNQAVAGAESAATEAVAATISSANAQMKVNVVEKSLKAAREAYKKTLRGPGDNARVKRVEAAAARAKTGLAAAQKREAVKAAANKAAANKAAAAAKAAAAKAAAEAKKAANAAAAKAAAEAKAAAAAQAAANAQTAAEAKKARNAQEKAEKAVQNAAAAQAKAVANAAQAQQDAAKKKVREFVLKLWPLTKGNFRGNQWQARITESNYIKSEISKFNPGLTVSQRNAIIANIIQAEKNKAIGHRGPYGVGGQNKNITQRLNRARALVNIVFPPLTVQEAAATKIAARWRGGAARNNLRKKAVANAFKPAPTRGSALASIASSTGSP